jgi:hypothetical protein
MIVELPHGGVVARLGSNEELTIGVHGGIGIQKLPKDGWGEFAPATAAMGEARQTNCLIVHDLVTPLSVDCFLVGFAQSNSQAATSLALIA